MKKLALLQLFLLPLAGVLAESPRPAVASSSAAVRCSEPSALESSWQKSESGLKSFAKRLVGFSYAQGGTYAAPR
jgi:hypothetical protein